MSNDTKHHFLARKIQDFQRSTARGYVCPACTELFQQEPKLWQHAKSSHPGSLGYTDPAGEAEARKQFRQEAIDRAQKSSRKTVRPPEPAVSKPSSRDDDSTRPNIGDEIRSPSPSRPFSAPNPARDPEKGIQNIDKLSIGHDPTAGYSSDTKDSTSFPHNPRKRGPAEDKGLPEPLPEEYETKNSRGTRHVKALSGGAYNGKDPDFDREALVASDSSFQRNSIGFAKRLFDPNTDNPSAAHTTHKSGLKDHASSARRANDSISNILRPQKLVSDGKGDLLPGAEYGQDDHPLQPLEYNDNPLGNTRLDMDHVQDDDWEPEPTMIPQPETRPISHDQLVVEVKGIYAGLVMVEAKCIEVDESQSASAQEKDPSRKNKLSNEQWQALIALHKQLLHEHHDFFLASQHPSASPALSKLAAKYAMPARMWRHGIHAFLEVLRHRLPESLDHMLAFIYIAYSMMALLFETVSTFEDTWIECLGDLARYRMAIEDDDIRDREVWSGVARFWYSKAADKSPNVGRLYHHLAILARPNSLQQLSLYAKSLTCVTPFESARGSIMTLFAPILHGKDSVYHRSSSLENVFIKAHGILFTGSPLREFDDAIQQLQNGLLDNYIGRVTAKFKEQGVFAAVANIAALFEYGALKQRGLHKSIFRLAFEEVNFCRNHRTNPQSVRSNAEHSDIYDEALPESLAHISQRQSVFSNLSASDVESSETIISRASRITFITLSLSLQRIGDKNVFPLIHVSFVFLWSLVAVEKAMKYVERDVPWGEICSFLNSLAKPETMTARVWGNGFPKPSDGVSRPLPEDFVLRGQLYSQFYYAKDWFQEAMIDDEERALELPSMVAPRVERILWLGIRIASFGRWIWFDKESYKFVITEYGSGLRTSSTPEGGKNLGALAKSDDPDITMSDAGLAAGNPWHVFNTNKTKLHEYSGDSSSLSRGGEDVESVQSMPEKFEFDDHLGLPASPDPKLASKSRIVYPKSSASPPKVHHHSFIAGSQKLGIMQDFDKLDVKEPFKP